MHQLPHGTHDLVYSQRSGICTRESEGEKGAGVRNLDPQDLVIKRLTLHPRTTLMCMRREKPYSGTG